MGLALGHHRDVYLRASHIGYQYHTQRDRPQKRGLSGHQW